MNAPVRIDQYTATSGYAAYERERDYSRRLERLLDRSLALLGMETHRRRLAGEDVEGIEAFIAEARKAGL